jgi:poly(A) polymerase
VQLAARLGFELAPSLAALCRAQDLSAHARERVRVELEKLLLSPRPGLGLGLLRTLGLEAQLWPGSPSGDALDHVAQSGLSDAAHRLAVQWALVVRGVDDRDAALDALDVHRWSGVPVRTLALRVCEQLDLISAPPTDAQLRAAADRVDVHLLLVALAALEPGVHVDEQLERAAALGVAGGPLPVLLTGRDLHALGVPAGPQMGAALSAVRRAQHDGVLDTAEQARDWVRSWLSQTPSRRL